MNRVAVLADIHGNLPALEAVLAEVAAIGPDLVVLNGDLADGPFPAETLDRLTSLGDRAVWLRGNADRWLVAARDGRFRHPDAATDTLLRWAGACITDAHRDRLAALPLTHSIDVADLGRIGVCHATARSDNEMLLVDSPLAHYRAAFAPLDGQVLMVGHCHMPFDRLFVGRRIVNTGSVGMPYGHSGASWATVTGGEIVLRRTLYDTDAATVRIARSGMPDAEAFIQTYVRAQPSDQEALDSFHRVERQQQEAGCFD